VLESALLMVFWLAFSVATVMEVETAVTVPSSVAGMVVMKVTVDVPLLRDPATALELTT